MNTLIASVIDRPAHAIGSLVETRPMQADRKRWEIPALLVLLLVAAIVRFWGVGSYSLHKPDEDTTALPAVHILQDGVPRFPSGMFYARAIAQSYLIAGSAKIFGRTEWALRLPSVLTGIVLVLLAYFLGRRFLDSPWNMAFVAVVALLPGMIADSQEVRMYIFLSATLAAYMILLFRWERTGRAGVFLAAVIALILAIQFQEIAVFSSFLLLFPGLAHGDARKLRQGLIALVVAGMSYVAMAHWNKSFYPGMVTGYLPVVSQTGDAPHAGALRFSLLILLPAVAGAIILVWFITRTMSRRGMAMLAAALLFSGLALQALLLYHLGLLLLIGGLVIARRHGGARGLPVLLLAMTSAAVAVAHLALLHAAHVGSMRKIVGVMVGEPSIWPYLQVSVYSPVAMTLVVAALGVGLWRLASGGRIRDDVLFAILGVFVPLFGIGFFGWYIAPRYGEFALLPMLLCALAAAQQFVGSRATTVRPNSTLVVASAATIACMGIVNPIAVAHSVNAGSRFPDHRAEAQYIRSLKLGPRDIVVAEEVLMQTYYLGHIDYWLSGPRNAADYVMRVNGRLADEYTLTPLIDSAAAFQALIDRPDRGTIYVIGSGENQEDGREFLRGPELNALLKSAEFVPVYQAPDGVTKIWKIAPTAASGAGTG
jgi:4-amino-4-deoxy-L-arabinose transferase-like glycosyltransferase